MYYIIYPLLIISLAIAFSGCTNYTQEKQPIQATPKTDMSNLKSYKMNSSSIQKGIEITVTDLQINGNNLGLYITYDNLSGGEITIGMTTLIANRHNFFTIDNKHIGFLGKIGKDIKIDRFITIENCPIKQGDTVLLRTSVEDSIKHSYTIDIIIQLPSNL